MIEKCQGVLLQSISYLGKQRILKVLTPDQGLLSLFAKSAKPAWGVLTTPFCIAEWVYQKNHKEMYLLKDGTLLDPLLELRRDYATLAAAGSMAKDVLRFQFPEKQDPALYQLFCACLKKLPSFSKPEILVASFRLKLLLHEGLLSLQAQCSHCSAPAHLLSQGESFCAAHSPMPALPFTPEEWEQLHSLAYTRQFSLLQQIPSAPCDKISRLLQEQNT